MAGMAEDSSVLGKLDPVDIAVRAHQTVVTIEAGLDGTNVWDVCGELDHSHQRCILPSNSGSSRCIRQGGRDVTYFKGKYIQKQVLSTI